MAYDLIGEIERMADRFNEMDADGLIGCLNHMATNVKADPKVDERVRRAFIRLAAQSLFGVVMKEDFVPC